MEIKKMIDEYFNIQWCFEDFFYAYCNAKGIDDPESDIDEVTYRQLEEECKKKLTYGFLVGLRECVIEDTNERIYMAMK